MNAHVRSALITCAMFASLTGLTACQNDHGSSASSQTSHAGAPTTKLTGTLRSSPVAPGAETTGWRLVGDGATGGFDVDASQVRDRATELDGKRVTVTGRMTTQNWPQRGPTQVLVAQSIEPAPAAK